MGRFRWYAADSYIDGQWFVMASPYRLPSKRYATQEEAEQAVKAIRKRERAHEKRKAAAYREQLQEARAEGEAAGYRRGIDDACKLLGERQFRMWATAVSAYDDRAADGVREAFHDVRKLAPVEPVSGAYTSPNAGGAQ